MIQYYLSVSSGSRWKEAQGDVTTDSPFPTFSCKVGQNDLTEIKRKLVMWCRLLTVYAKYRKTRWK